MMRVRSSTAIRRLETLAWSTFCSWCGKIGGSIARLLAGCGDYDVLVGDVSDAALQRLPAMPQPSTSAWMSPTRRRFAAMKGRKIVASACSFDVNVGIAKAALAEGLSYFDLTEDVETTAGVQRVAR